MVKSYILSTFILLVFTHNLNGQKDIRSFIFGHSLINHEAQVNLTPSQETSVPHWMHFLVQETDHSYAVSGQYGFLLQHANLPPIAQWGFDYATSAWESDYEDFSAANFNNILITPGNFIQWQGPEENYYMENSSPLDATESIIDWCIQQEEGIQFYIYENWPDMASYLNNGFPPSQDEWGNYNEYLNDEFHNWFLEYHDKLIDNIPDACIKMIPVGPLISNLLGESPYNQIPIDLLYEDDAPHGQANIYFLASLITYMATYEEKAPHQYQPQSIIHPIIIDNYSSIVDFFWDELTTFNLEDGQSRVFCEMPITSSLDVSTFDDEVKVSPNPAVDFLHINSNIKQHTVDVYSLYGEKVVSAIPMDAKANKVDMSFVPNGLYILVGKDKSNTTLYSKKIIKTDGF